MDRIDLNVPFAEKNKAKAAGAKWDALHRTWYWPGSKVPDGLAKYTVPGLRADSAIMADVAARIDELIADLPAAYERRMAVGELLALIRAEKISQHKFARLVIPILQAAGAGPVIRAAQECLLDTVYGDHPTLPDSGIATLDEFMMMALPKKLRPADALDLVRRTDSGQVIMAGMKAVYLAEIKKRNLL